MKSVKYIVYPNDAHYSYFPNALVPRKHVRNSFSYIMDRVWLAALPIYVQITSPWEEK